MFNSRSQPCTNCSWLKSTAATGEQWPVKRRPHYLLHYFTAELVAIVYILPVANANVALQRLPRSISSLRTGHLQTFYVAAEDFSHNWPTDGHSAQHITIPTKVIQHPGRCRCQHRGCKQSPPFSPPQPPQTTCLLCWFRPTSPPNCRHQESLHTYTKRIQWTPPSQMPTNGSMPASRSPATPPLVLDLHYHNWCAAQCDHRTWAGTSTGLSPANIQAPKRQVLRDCTHQLSKVLKDIYNTSLSQASVPTCMKTASTFPVPNSLTVTGLSDYRPVVLYSNSHEMLREAGYGPYKEVYWHHHWPVSGCL